MRLKKARAKKFNLLHGKEVEVVENLLGFFLPVPNKI